MVNFKTFKRFNIQSGSEVLPVTGSSHRSNFTINEMKLCFKLHFQWCINRGDRGKEAPREAKNLDIVIVLIQYLENGRAYRGKILYSGQN